MLLVVQYQVSFLLNTFNATHYLALLKTQTTQKITRTYFILSFAFTVWAC